MPQRSVGHRLLFYVIGISSAITLILTGLQLYWEYHRDLDDLHSNFQRIQHSVVPAMASAVQSGNKDQAQQYAEALLQWPSIVSVSIIAPRKPYKPYVTGHSSGESVDVIEHQFDLGCQSQDEGYCSLGQLAVTFRLQPIYSNLYQRIGVVLLSNAVKTCLVALCFIVLFKHLLGQHLHDITTDIRAMTADEFEHPLRRSHNTLADTAGDELDELAHATKQLRSNQTSERKKIQLSDQHYQALVENTTEAIWHLRFHQPIPMDRPMEEQIRQVFEQAYFVEWNEAFKTIHGYNDEEIPQLKLSQLFSLTDPRNLEAVCRIVESGYNTTNTQVTTGHADGSDIIERVNIRSAIENGCCIGLWGASTVISDRVEAEQALQTNLEHLRKMDAVSTALARDAEPKSRLQNTLATVLELFDADRAWLLYPNDPTAEFFRVPLEATHPDYPGASSTAEALPRSSLVADVMATSLATDGPIVYEPPHPLLNHEQLRVFNVQSQMIIAVRPKYGSPWLIGLHQCRYGRLWTAAEQGLFKDIAQRIMDTLGSYLYLEALRESEARLSEAQAVAHMGHWVRDIRRNKMTWSDEIFRIFGLPLQSLTPTVKHFALLIHPDDRTHVLHTLRDAVHQPTSAEFHIIGGDGKQRYVFATATGSVDDHGIATRLFGVVQDITERKQLEEQTREQQMQIIQADKMASLGLMVSGVAHEINNPNNLIQINAALMKDMWRDAKPILEDYSEQHKTFTMGGLAFDEASESVPELFAGVNDASQRIQRIVHGLKDFTRRGDHGAVSETPVNEAIENASRLLYPLITEKTNHFQLALAKGLPPIMVNPQHIEQIAINLLTNALDAIPDKAYPVSITTALTDGQVEIRVKDSGIGIPRAKIKQIFDPFFTTKQAQGGTGLGLAITYNLVQTYHGTLVCDSQEGVGTMFTVRFPAMTTMD